MSDRATSNTRDTCMGYNTEGLSWGWATLVAHPGDHASRIGSFTPGAAVTPPPLGVTVSKLDGFAGWVKHEDLSVYQNVNNLYHSR